MIELNKIYREDCIEGMKRIPNESVDCILTDPPYLYLKNQKLDRPFDEDEFFNECKRVLKKDGFIVLFGRGTSFYRWNTKLANMGFNFKEEIVWDKRNSTSPLMALSRVHETVSIHSKGKGTINRSKIPYLEIKQYDLESICKDINRIKSILNNTKSLDAVLSFLEKNKIDYNMDRIDGLAPSYHLSSFKNTERASSVMSCISSGLNEKTIIRTDRVYSNNFTKYGVNCDKRKTGDRAANGMQSISFGLNEKSIIKEVRDHYSAIHPTQKPTRLLERLLALTTTENTIILDPFSGSASTAVACINTNRNFICFEIDEEYYNKSIERIKAYENNRTSI